LLPNTLFLKDFNETHDVSGFVSSDLVFGIAEHDVQARAVQAVFSNAKALNRPWHNGVAITAD
jgi:hypothetical protein